MATQREIRKWTRRARASFPYFVDWTYRWDSDYNDADGRGYRLEPYDATREFTDAIQNFQDWHSLNYLAPRGTAKSTMLGLAVIWTKWHVPHLQSLILTATPDVADDGYRYAHRMCTDHWLLEHMRPLNSNEGKKQFDIPGMKGKGRSFRWRTAGGRVTGGRCHFLGVDDLEVKETVATPEQRLKMRLALAESHNLLYAAQRTWIIKTGTPWDADTIYRDLSADIHLEIPAIIKDEDTGDLIYPFHVWSAESLRKKQLELSNDLMFHYQYLMDTRFDDQSRPIKRDQILFEAFDDALLNNRTLICDPAGGKKSASDIKAIRVGEKSGDGMGAMAVGTKNNRLYVSDIFSKSTTQLEYLTACRNFATRYRLTQACVESNYGGAQGWPHTIENDFISHNIFAAVEDRHSTGNKLATILELLLPLVGTGQVVFHERLRDCPFLVDEKQSQLLNLRYVSLPAKDDVIDMIKMAIEELHEYVYVEVASQPDNSMLAQARRAHAPTAVQRMLGLQKKSRISSARVYRLPRR